MTNREKEVLRVLASDVRTFSDRQVATTWWSDCPTGLHRCRVALNRLQRKGWLVLGKVLARSVKLSAKPVYRWSPGDPSPDFVSHARTLHERVLKQPELVTICMATEKTNNLLGVGRRSTVRLAQLTHELLVSQVYLRYRSLGFENANWIGEDRLPAEWRLRVRPDALLVDINGNFVRAVEYGGDYSVERLEELHLAISSILLSYELW